MSLLQAVPIWLGRKVPLRPILLAICLGVVAVGVFALARALIPVHSPTQEQASSPPAAFLALTAYFPNAGDEARPLWIKGWVTGAPEPVAGTKVKLTLRRLQNDFYQTYVLEVNAGGTFEAPDVEGFTAITSAEPIRLTAETWLPNHDGQPTRLFEEVYLNARPPIVSSALYYPLVLTGMLFLGTFLWAFTGKSSAVKNRLAIGFSYLIILIFLALPLLAPVLLPLAFPGALRVMRETPVGLVVTNIDAKPEAGPQWALNIGGHITQTSEAAAANIAQASKAAASDIVKVEGGLVIPLYVILLSVIGGAINMTRQVPKFQEACETQVNSRLRSDPVHTPQAAVHLGRTAWRTELLNQYMFLISAPFLAIATYYMLMGLDLTKVPVMVLMAFSVGLISESILRTITETAERLLRQPSAQSPATAGAGQVIRPVAAASVAGK